MTLITDTLDRIARQCSVDIPDSWITASEEEHVAIRDDFLLETVDDILERVDLPSPIGAQTAFAGTGVEDYTLPSNFKRLQRDKMAVYETTTNRRACVPVTDDGAWTHIKEMGTAGVERYYRLKGYEDNWEISFYQNPAAGVSITVSYITKNWMANDSGTAGSAFTAAEDILLLPRRVVELGAIYRFRDRNGLPFEKDMLLYEAHINRLSNDRRVRFNIGIGDSGVGVAPWDVPVPDYIPEA